MLKDSPQVSPQVGFFDLISQLDQKHPLLLLADEIDWQFIDKQLSVYYSDKGRPGKPIRLMCGLLMLKQMFNLSDDNVIAQWTMNPYYQVFCGEVAFQTEPPCCRTDITAFRQRIGETGVNAIFAASVALHEQEVEEDKVLVDTTVQEKAITYPTDTKLAISIINRLNKLAKKQGIRQRRTYVKEVKQLRLQCRPFRHPKVRGKARRALKRLRTIAGTLLRELQRKLPAELLSEQQDNFALYEKVLTQQPKDKNKIYSLHEPGVYCVGKGKDHKPYEYGRKASVVSTLKGQVIIGVASHDEPIHDSKTLSSALNHARKHRKSPIVMAIADRGYRGAQQYVHEEVLLPKLPLKRDSSYQRQTKRKLCRQRAAIEPIIGHLKHDFRLSRNWLRGSVGDPINLLMAACAWNLRKRLRVLLLPLIYIAIRAVITALKRRVQ